MRNGTERGDPAPVGDAVTEMIQQET